MTALVGESGSGKSTVTDLVLGMQIPERGQVLIDGVSLGDWKQNSFRERVGYVPQDPLLFNTSIRNNLLWSFEQANEDDLWGALRLANAEGFVKELPQGIDTLVGDRGVRLSGGQRQRIALARALLRKPELLILDEATSSLDSESELLIQQSIEQVAQDTRIVNGTYVILPQFVDSCLGHNYEAYPIVPDGFAYRSDTNDKWVTTEQLAAMIDPKLSEAIPVKEVASRSKSTATVDV